KTPLHLAVLDGDIIHTEALLKAGASPCAKDNFGKEPLHYGVEKSIAMVTLLIKHGANVNAKDTAGKEPHFFAPAGSSNVPVLRLLFEKGAK
ncbi:ankyrin repeat-containing domain protein, partial [Lasiosphaeris hirsuta]